MTLCTVLRYFIFLVMQETRESTVHVENDKGLHDGSTVRNVIVELARFYLRVSGVAASQQFLIAGDVTAELTRVVEISVVFRDDGLRSLTTVTTLSYQLRCCRTVFYFFLDDKVRPIREIKNMYLQKWNSVLDRVCPSCGFYT